MWSFLFVANPHFVYRGAWCCKAGKKREVNRLNFFGLSKFTWPQYSVFNDPFLSRGGHSNTHRNDSISLGDCYLVQIFLHKWRKKRHLHYIFVICVQTCVPIYIIYIYTVWRKNSLDLWTGNIICNFIPLMVLFICCQCFVELRKFEIFMGLWKYGSAASSGRYRLICHSLQKCNILKICWNVLPKYW